MKKALRRLVVVAAAMMAGAAMSFTLPQVGTGTSPNVWTRNMDGVLKAAKTTGLPIFLVMINDRSDGEGCSHCAAFVERTLESAQFAAMVKEYQFYMVLLNRWGEGGSGSQPQYGGVSPDYFNKYFYKYAADDGYPVVAVIRSNGVRYAGWGDSTRPVGTRGTTVCGEIRKAIDALCVKKTVFALSPQSGEVKADAEAATAQQFGVWTGTVTRSGGSKKTGSVNVTISGDNAAKYKLNPASLAWDANDGAKTFTLTIADIASLDGGIIADTLNVSIAASGFSGSTVSYGAKTATVTFKDKRIKKTMAEFSKENAGFSNLSSSDKWFVPANDEGLFVSDSVASNETSELKWTATKGGVATFAAKANDTLTAKINGGDPIPITTDEMTIGVGVGDVVVITAKGTNETENTAVGELGLATMSFEELKVTLDAPQNGAELAWPAVCADPSLVDLAWTGVDGATYEVFGGVLEGTNYVGEAVTTNGVEAGIIQTNTVMGTCKWGVRATDTNVMHGAAVTVATSSFSISAKPKYEGMPTSVSAFLKAGTTLDLSASAPAGTGPITYSASGLPAGLKIDSKTGRVTGSPTKAGTYRITVTAKNAYGSANTVLTLSVAKFPKSFAGKYNGIFFDGQQRMLGSATWKIASNGKWSAKLFRGGKTTSVKGEVSVNEDNAICLSASGFSATRAAGASLWTGTWGGLKLLGKTTEKLGEPWVATWNCAVNAPSAAGNAGYANVVVKKSGKASFAGKVAAKDKFGGSGLVLSLSEAEVKAHLSNWAGRKAVLFVYGWKKVSGRVFDGGFALCGDWTTNGDFTFGGLRFDDVTGSKWSAKQSLASLTGKSLKTATAEVTLHATAKKVWTSAKFASVKAATKNGVIKGSFSGGGTCKFEGVLFLSGGVLKGFGGGSDSSGRFVFVVE